MADLIITMQRHHCKIEECVIFVEVTVHGYRSFVLDEVEYSEFVKNFDEQAEDIATSHGRDIT